MTALDGPLPSTDPLPWIDAWSRSPALAKLVSVFGGESGSGHDLGAWLAYLETFSERWDFRGGQERNLVDPRSFSAEVEEQIAAAADELRLRGMTEPPRDRYRHVVVLGGLVRACLARPRRAADLLAARKLVTDRVIALGGFRALKGDEERLVEQLLDEAISDEHQAMNAGVRAAFALGSPAGTRGVASDVLGASWDVTDYVTPGGLPLHVVAAPSSQPGVRRANTPDTYAWLAAESGWLEPGDRILLVTTDIYVPFQHADAVRMLTLPHGVEVDAIGVVPGLVDPRLAQEFATHNYLQEIRSAIRSLRLLHAALAA